MSARPKTDYKTQFIVFEGMDVCGKSTLLQDVQRDFEPCEEIKFKKTLPSGALLRMNTEKDFEILLTLFEHLDRSKCYLLDRFMISNLVYDKVLRGEDTELTNRYWYEFNDRFDVLTVVLTRPHIDADFVDDRIKLTRQQFNDALDEYKKYGFNWKLLKRDEHGNPTGRDEVVKDFIYEQIRTHLNQL